MMYLSFCVQVFKVKKIEVIIYNLENYNITFLQEGRPSGEAYIELETEADSKKALKMNKEELQGRYIEIFPSSGDEMEYVLEKAERQANQPWDNVVRLRGIPFKASFLLSLNFSFSYKSSILLSYRTSDFQCTAEKLRLFFKDIEIPPNGIVLVTDTRGRNTGEGFIQFNSHEHADQALLKHKETIDRRFGIFSH